MTAVPTKISAGQVTEISTMETSVSMVEPLHTATNTVKENTAAVYTQVPVDVATYLLNEKRVDVARIEARHKVRIVVIPNRHLETPAYEVVRLRHDHPASAFR